MQQAIDTLNLLSLEIVQAAQKVCDASDKTCQAIEKSNGQIKAAILGTRHVQTIAKEPK